ncbi:ABC transporter permease [Eremococcus coleocola]|uniref:ABC-2 type transporter n=1 Tax=Eremococcus coleocola ACS-139-V-Col8 TaxID=908337 RepID=E4KLQ3_9LACT|nr:ABC transporter permease [Eremococcus coleocola]EFR31959.1 ABC-2 type transporter [Eremococcus coleocola ACS-139-V-Col8]
MLSIRKLTLRNIKLYLRDKSAVFFSFLSVIILISLYLLFLKNAYKHEVLEQVMNAKEIDFMVDSLILSGIMVINTITLSLGNLGSMIQDLESHRINAFIVTPVKRYKLILAYFASSFMITLTFSLLMWVGALALIYLTTGIMYPSDISIKATGLVILYTFISTAFMILLTTFIKSVNAFGAVSGVFGTLIGFTSGIYMPLSQFPDYIQKISAWLPFTHMTIYLKQLLLKPSFDLIGQKIPREVMDMIQTVYATKSLPITGEVFDPVWVLLVSCIIGLFALIWATFRMKHRIRS